MAIIDFHIPEELDKKEPYVWLASWFGFGFLRPAPGTWGSLGALPFGLLIYIFGGINILYACIIIFTIIGLWAAAKFDKAMNGHDSKMIVIDEVVGQWIALVPTALNPILIIVSFLFFRVFDILKPWPVSFFDKDVDGAAGVMCDDIVAGLMAAVCVMGLDTLI